MNLSGWKTAFAWCALVALMWVGATSADAQTVITGPGHVTASDSALRFNGTVMAVGQETVALRVDGQVARVPITIAKFSANGVDIDPSKLYAGLPVTVSLGSVRGTVTAMHGTTMVVHGPNGLVELPSYALRTASLEHATVAFRDVNGHVTLLPVETALDLQQRQLGHLAYGTQPNSATNVAIVSPRTPGVAVVVTPTGTTDVDLGRSRAAVRVSPATAFVGPIAAAALPEYPLVLEGHVATVTPTALVLDTRGVLVTIPKAAKATVHRNGKIVAWHQLGVGNRVQVTVPPLAIRGVSAGAVTYQLSNGAYWTVPAAALPMAYREQTMVWMRDTRGDVTRVPLETALAVQRQGAVYFAPGAVAVPPEDRYDSRFAEPPFPERERLEPTEQPHPPYQPYDGGWPFDGRSNFDEPLETHPSGE